MNSSRFLPSAVSSAAVACLSSPLIQWFIDHWREARPVSVALRRDAGGVPSGGESRMLGIAPVSRKPSKWESKRRGLFPQPDATNFWAAGGAARRHAPVPLRQVAWAVHGHPLRRRPSPNHLDSFKSRPFPQVQTLSDLVAINHRKNPWLGKLILLAARHFLRALILLWCRDSRFLDVRLADS